ncbi:uncharacterized protein LTR77_009453 [Saxophila tyrrhenica]|uniref:Glycosyltransferase family 28 N-terminal domain-containing protein n=1 Tax=Saxophila tyrrhenica TaxID=1690608 RepID=A0AAV9P128_9PEZI|nr:hypothetical protein LTR77_009453 [Saxophila tyrrhenica]
MEGKSESSGFLFPGDDATQTTTSDEPRTSTGGGEGAVNTTQEQSQTMQRSATDMGLPSPATSGSAQPQLEVQRSATQDFGHAEPPIVAPTKSRTAPAEQRTRPGVGQRKSTLLGSMKRSRTGTQSQLGRSDTYEYAFKDAPLSDSESSDSSSDEEAEDRKDPVPQATAPQPSQPLDTTEVKTTDDQKVAKRRYAYSRFTIGNDLFKTKGRVSRKDGRLKISINETANSGYIAKALGQSIRNHLDIPHRNRKRSSNAESPHEQAQEEEAESIASSLRTSVPRPRLNIVIMVIGSRGDIQPFLKIGKILRHEHGHRVRIASHPVFRDFVERDGGLEFFSVGGDPSELMAFMVKNPGLIPNMQTLREGEIGRRRAAMAQMFEGFWRACVNTTDGETDEGNLKMMESMEPFVADAIIANPPSMAHVHVAERLGIPLHMFFTFPYSPTTMFPHPLANIKPRRSNVDAGYVNFMSYPLVEMMTWQGLGDIVNKFRENTLHLEPVSSLWAPGALYRMKVPYTYLWSPSLVPKPQDWGPEIDIAGFVFMDLASSFKPPQELTDFLDAGEPPVYIGFGSIVVDDPDKFTDMIFQAAEKAGVRALVHKGWGGFGRSNKDTPKNVFMLDNTPHDWLFPRVKAVVHHGGAGTTAIGLKCGKPTMIVPFFGDQPFWGAMVADAKAGAHECIPYKRLTMERLAEGIRQCLTDEAQENVQRIADSMAKEGDGAENAVKSFHRSLSLAGRHSMRCSILQDRVAVWTLRKSSLRLSALAAQMLHKQGKLKWGDLKLIRHHEWNDFDGPGEPFTGGVGALSDSLYGISEGIGMVPVRISKHIHEREQHERRKRARQKRKAERESRKAAEATRTKQEPSTDRPPNRRELTNDTSASALSADPSETLPHEVIDDLSWGLRRTGAAILTMPNDFHVALAQGLHNSPRLYGDSTVRKPTKITGFKSGCTAARNEFVYGISDGWTGLVRQPRGDWEDGEGVVGKMAGLGTGVGKGVGGFVIKNTNAIVAPPGYVVKGFFKWVENRQQGPGSKAFIRRSRIVAGEQDLWGLEKEGAEKAEQAKAEVKEGWGVYEEIWAEAQKEFGHLGGNLVGKYRMRREKKEWDVNGALESVDTAGRALRARKDGKDLEKFFERRREEMERAEQPRAPVMEQPKGVDEGEEVLPNGRTVEDLERKGERRRDESSREEQDTGLSESTAVATPEDEKGANPDFNGASEKVLDENASHLQAAVAVR